MKIKLIVALTPLLLLAGCARYKAKTLRPLEVERVTGHENEELFVGVKAFTKKESKEYLGKDAVKKGYYPIQIAIKNGTQRYLDFSHAGINLITIKPELFAQNMYDKTLVRAAGWGATGFVGFGIFAPVAIWTAVSLMLPTVPGVLLLTVPYVAFVPTVVDSLWSVEANEQMLADYLHKAIPDNIIKPQARLEGLIFVTRADFKNDFSLVLVDTNTQEKIVYTTNLGVQKRY